MSEENVSQLPNECDATRHLAELGYVDPREVAVAESNARARQEAALRASLELWKQGRGADAAALVEELVENAPSWIMPRRWLVEIYYQAGRFDDAQQQLDWLTWHGVESPRLSHLAGGIALARRDIRSALDLLTYAAYVEPSLPGLHRLLGTVQLRLRKLAASEKSFRAALGQHNSDARALEGMSAVSLLHGEYEEAAEWALKALQQDMQLFRAHYNLGVALTHLRRPMEAVRALEIAAQVDSKRAAPYYWLQRIAERQLNDAAKGATYRDRGRALVRLRRQRRKMAGRSSTAE